MKTKHRSFLFMLIFCAFSITQIFAQYNFPDCGTPWDPANAPFRTGDVVSYQGNNYTAKYYTTSTPGSGEWTNNGPCGVDAVGPDYAGPQRIIGYLPTWQKSWDRANFNPNAATHINISFLEFIQNNNDYTSNNFSSVAFKQQSIDDVDSVLFDLGILAESHQAGVTVSIALGGAIDYSFLWLMNKYHNNDAKLDEIAELIKTFVVSRNLDGVDLDMEAWWQDPAVNKMTDEGGRVRGDKWGGTDAGPHPAGLGLTKLAKKLREKMPNKLITAAVFGTSWYGNNYDDEMVQYMDWLGLMTYDFTGSWDASAVGPHSSLYKVPSGYQGQSANNPIYSAEDALEYWMGFAEPAWNHDGGFAVPKAKLAIGVPCYGYDMALPKTNGGNGFEFVPYKDIVAQYPNAATSYDPNFVSQRGGYIGEDGKKLYYNTPELAAAKINYTHDYGHQGIIVWEMTMDAPYNSSSSILKAMMDAKIAQEGGNNNPNVSLNTPDSVAVGSNVTLSADASDTDGSIAQVAFFVDGISIGVDATAPYSVNWIASSTGTVSISAVATDNEGATGSNTRSMVIEDTTNTNEAPTVSVSAPSSATTGTSVTLSATASDADGTITQVQFFVDNTLVGTDDTSPYSVAWTAVLGTHSVTAVATDNDNASTTSTAVNMTVSDVVDPNNPPTISLAGPTSGLEGDVLTFTATASDTDGTISQVEFFLNGTVSLGIDTDSPYSLDWTSVEGNQSITATATDDDGASTTSAAILVQVSGTGNGVCDGVDAYVPNQTYLGGDRVVAVDPATGQSALFEAKWWTNSAPGDDTWQYISACAGGDTGSCGGIAAYRSGTAYNGGDQVAHEGNIYSAKWWTNTIPGSDNTWNLDGPCPQANARGITSTPSLESASKLMLYPNPALQEVNLSLYLAEGETLRITLLNVQGQILSTLKDGYMASGQHRVQFSIADLPAGVFLIKLETGNNQQQILRLFKR
ncbi:MAG: Ig-like domain-containing protein [Flammeovirgaceae bacterium]